MITREKQLALLSKNSLPISKIIYRLMRSNDKLSYEYAKSNAKIELYNKQRSHN